MWRNKCGTTSHRSQITSICVLFLWERKRLDDCSTTYGLLWVQSAEKNEQLPAALSLLAMPCHASLIGVVVPQREGEPEHLLLCCCDRLARQMGTI